MNRRTGRLALTLAPIVALLVFLLWPLSSREWDIEPADGASDEKEAMLAAQPRVGRPAPRVVVILADDLGPTDMSLYGGRWVQTPNIDSIGRDGVTFTDASCTTAVCAPSRAAMLTGRYQQRFGFEVQPHTQYARNWLQFIGFRYFVDTSPMVPIAPAPIPTRSAIREQGLPGSEIMISELLSARGYATAAFGKWHLGYTPEFSPLVRGFDEHYGFYDAFSLYAPRDDPSIVNRPVDDFSDHHMWAQGRTGPSAIVHNDQIVEEDEYLTFRFAELAADYIGEHADEPFFLYVPFSAPHTPLQAPREYYEKLTHIADPIRRTYYAMIAALDDGVGTILAAVDDAGIADSTLVVFASDNGGVTYLDVTDNGPYAGGKFSTFQGGLSVPLMMRYPEVIPPGTVYDRPVSLMDVFATVDAATRPPSRTDADAANNGAGDGTDDDERLGAGTDASVSTGAGAVDHPVDGVDLIPYVLGETRGDPHPVLFWRSFYNSAARSGPWKLIRQAAGSPGTRDDLLFLYNLDRDPYEQRSVAEENPKIVGWLLEQMAEWDSRMSPPLWPPVMHFQMDIWGRTFWFAI